MSERDPGLVVDADLVVALLCLQRETASSTVLEAVAKAHAAWKGAAILPSPMALAGYLDELTALRDRLRLVEHRLQAMQGGYQESERRRVAAEERLRLIAPAPTGDAEQP